MTEQPQTKVLRWGILATGGISTNFTKDLLIDASTRGQDFKHAVVAVGSRSKDRADAFIRELGLDIAKGYGSAVDLFNDPNVDVVYVGTPNSNHYPASKAALLAGKHVLCEKGFTINAKQAEELVRISEEKRLFLMEAMWSRFFPATIAIQEVIAGGKIGTVRRVFADLAQDFKTFDMDDGHRLIAPSLGGGALLDLMPYTLHWALLTLFPHPAEISSIPKIVGQMTISRSVDLHTTAVLSFDELPSAQAVISGSMAAGTVNQVVVQGSEGTLTVSGVMVAPTGYKIKYNDEREETVECSDPNTDNAFGFCFEQDEVGRQIFAGSVESPRNNHQTSIRVMTILDEIKRQGGLILPQEIERV
ncbi:Dimeric dihydrodiol dehydrogenase [Phaffia rhodozyma]|uniref:D-xylose 1-dehydrogenase (NADP(+), D-xylono-1,5-lactone-forming) n=1 Tax=Phaffia rhodozyma TaxID=264483 RepID=A0A0F7SK39_PHARH|nr:Dimeric dihydrodiol dehydrogenase [Phaffia rhodozyma]